MNRKSALVILFAIAVISLVMLITDLYQLPFSSQSPFQGTYVKIDPSYPQWWLCRRCADYRPAGGIWRMGFDDHFMRIEYEVTGWHSQAVVEIDGERLRLRNDPYCPDEVGEYIWKFNEGQLSLTLGEDGCSFGLRAENLAAQVWQSCQPPRDRGKVDGWHPPTGCLDLIPEDELAPHVSHGYTVTVHGGDSRFFDRPPDIFALANSTANRIPDGIIITFHPESISYGLQRVLWWDGPWIEATTEVPFVAIGVQFLGDPSIGWARLIFDGVEVWRGDTAVIWSWHGRHGGYVEVSGFPPGEHALRVESLGFDYRPVTVASFGFSDTTGVDSEQP